MRNNKEQFASDNYSGACPEVLEALIKSNEGSLEAYGNVIYTKKCDVYSFAIVMFEIVTRKIPYAKRKRLREGIRSLTKKGEREKLPQYTPTLFKEIITDCWAQ